MRTPTRNPKNNIIFVAALIGAPATGADLESFPINQEAAVKPPRIKT
ncbi:hypothetical protein KAU88_06110 [Candidatus Bathyarchaeota archaeon]|nr:hypothetical protein [Candidatus Bathyarchaeota archaeon]